MITAPHGHPREVLRIMWPQILRPRLIVAHHFARRHATGAAPVHSWIAEIRRIDSASGFSNAVRQCGASLPHYRNANKGARDA